MAIEYATPGQRFLKYDGTNAQEIVDAAGSTISFEHSMVGSIDEADGVLTFTINAGPYGNLNYTLNNGDRLAVDQMGGVISQADYESQYIRMP